MRFRKTLWTILFTIAIVSLSTVAIAQKKIAVPSQERRFDHAAHNAMTNGKGLPPPACDGPCHSMDDRGRFKLTGKREHARCFESCHGEYKHKFSVDPSTLKGASGRTCVTCHGDKIKHRPVEEGLVNEIDRRGYVARYSHKSHADPQASSKQCEGCHGTFGDSPPKTSGVLNANHSLCASCHEKNSKPTMRECFGCHSEGSLAKQDKLPASIFSVAGKFSHVDHANSKRVGKKGRRCFACHGNIGSGKNDLSIPLPTMQGCWQSCHNGKKAFDVLGATCTQCHQAPTSANAPKELPVNPIGFVHGSHGNRGANVSNCATCHTLDAAFTVKPATQKTPHAPCSNESCHASEFFQATPTICGACHQDSSPWKKQEALTGRSITREFTSDLSHASHVEALKKQGAKGCQNCHGNVYEKAKSRTRGHVACASCHNGKSKPFMTNCDGCHKTGPTSEGRQISEWSVSERFSHANHKQDPRLKQTTKCELCHGKVEEARTLREVKPPTMRSCDACHNGKTSFKTTGFQCYRCHQQKEAPIAWADQAKGRL